MYGQTEDCRTEPRVRRNIPSRFFRHWHQVLFQRAGLYQYSVLPFSCSCRYIPYILYIRENPCTDHFLLYRLEYRSRVCTCFHKSCFSLYSTACITYYAEYRILTLKQIFINKKQPPYWVIAFKCRHLPIFPDRHQSSIFGTIELNFRVRYGNGWTLNVIDTSYSFVVIFDDFVSITQYSEKCKRFLKIF